MGEWEWDTGNGNRTQGIGLHTINHFDEVGGYHSTLASQQLAMVKPIVIHLPIHIEIVPSSQGQLQVIVLVGAHGGRVVGELGNVNSNLEVVRFWGVASIRICRKSVAVQTHVA